VNRASTGIATKEQTMSKARFQPGMGKAGVAGEPLLGVLSPKGGMLGRKSSILGLQFMVTF
jgi:hypothetical protein